MYVYTNTHIYIHRNIVCLYVSVHALLCLLTCGFFEPIVLLGLDTNLVKQHRTKQKVSKPLSCPFT